MTGTILPDNPLAFITRCLRENKIVWTYHLNMRLAHRSISRDEILTSVNSMEVIEEYPEDKYLPSYLLYARSGKKVFHVQIATDVPGDNIRIITAYQPDPVEWDETLKKRRRL